MPSTRFWPRRRPEQEANVLLVPGSLPPPPNDASNFDMFPSAGPSQLHSHVEQPRNPGTRHGRLIGQYHSASSSRPSRPGPESAPFGAPREDDISRYASLDAAVQRLQTDCYTLDLEYQGRDTEDPAIAPIWAYRQALKRKIWDAQAYLQLHLRGATAAEIEPSNIHGQHHAMPHEVVGQLTPRRISCLVYDTSDAEHRRSIGDHSSSSVPEGDKQSEARAVRSEVVPLPEDPWAGTATIHDDVGEDSEIRALRQRSIVRNVGIRYPASACTYSTGTPRPRNGDPPGYQQIRAGERYFKQRAQQARMPPTRGRGLYPLANLRDDRFVPRRAAPRAPKITAMCVPAAFPERVDDLSRATQGILLGPDPPSPHVSFVPADSHAQHVHSDPLAVGLQVASGGLKGTRSGLVTPDMSISLDTSARELQEPGAVVLDGTRQHDDEHTADWRSRPPKPYPSDGGSSGSDSDDALHMAHRPGWNHHAIWLALAAARRREHSFRGLLFQLEDERSGKVVVGPDMVECRFSSSQLRLK